MCGIAGILNFSDQPNEPSLIRKMTGAMAHRGPDAEGFFSAGGMDFGHLRLSIIDLSSAANQPFADNTGRYTIVFNGEMYNYQHVKSLMPEYSFHTTSDTEVLIAAYAKWGAACLDHFRGMFALAIWDSQEKELFLARDRMGVKPLYYYIDGEKLVFASEVRGILATGLVARKLSRQGLVEYFSYQSVSYPFSMIDGISQLEAASWMRIKNGQVEKGVYWDLTRSASDTDFSDHKRTERRIRDLMLQSIERRLVSDVPVGAFLSGGIDSSIVVGLMAEAGSSRPNTFNIAFEEKEFDESPFAEIIARKFDTNHTKIMLKPTVFLDELQNALNAMDSPSGDGINSYVVSKAIRQKGMTVALSGAGGDELFAGYPFFAQYLQLQSKKALWKTPALFRKLLAGAWSAGNAEGKRGKIAQFLALPSVDIDQVYPVFRQILSPRLLGQLTDLSGPARAPGAVPGSAPNTAPAAAPRTAPATASDTAPDTAVARELRSKKREIGRLPLLSQVSVAEYLGYTQHTLLKDTDQMSMAVSLEVREPFFDQDLVEFVLSIPDALKKPVYPKSLLVESLKPMLPDEVVHRRKQGFLFPWEHWLKNELRPFGERHIKNMAQRPFVKGGALLDYWHRFLAGDKNVRWSELWLFIVLEYWLEKNQVTC